MNPTTVILDATPPGMLALEPAPVPVQTTPRWREYPAGATGPPRQGSEADVVGTAGTGPRSRPPGPRRPAPRPRSAPTSRAALGLLRQATEGLAEAHREPDPLVRYPTAYLAALRGGAAVLAVRAVPQPRRGATRNVWQLLARVAPELAEWAAFFAACSATRSAAEAGIARLVGQRDADDLLRQTEQFLELVERAVPHGVSGE